MRIFLKRAIGILLIMLMLIIIFLFYKIGYIPIVGKVIAEKKLSAYANHTQMRLSEPIKVRYSWYNGEYQCSNYSLNLYYFLQNNSIYDGTVGNQISEKLAEDYKDIKGHFPKNIIMPEDIMIWSTVNADDYEIKSQRLYMLGVYNTENLPEDESAKMPAKIATEFIELLGKDYNIAGIQLIYADKNGMYDIAIRADTFLALEYDKLLKSTTKRSENELPLDYIEWLEKND